MIGHWFIPIFGAGSGPSPPPVVVDETTNLLFYDARFIDWQMWASNVVWSALPDYNLPNPGVEGLWQAWATELLNVTGLAERGVPDPRSFGDDWRGWAAALVFTTS